MCGLEHLAFRCEDSRGRRWPAGHDQILLEIKDPFQADVAKIRDSISFQRLKEEYPGHVADFESLAELIRDSAEELGLNASLAEAIIRLRGISRTIFYPEGEKILTGLLNLDQPFMARKFALFIAEKVDGPRQGLNLSYETLFGSLCSGYFPPDRDNEGGFSTMYHVDDGYSQEASLAVYIQMIVSILKHHQALSDRHESNIGREHRVDLAPLDEIAVKIGLDYQSRLSACLKALKEESLQANRVLFYDSKEAKNLMKLRYLMDENGYRLNGHSPEAPKIIQALYQFFSSLLCSKKSAVLALALIRESQVRQIFTSLEKKDQFLWTKIEMESSKIFLMDIGRIRLLSQEIFWDYKPDPTQFGKH